MLFYSASSTGPCIQWIFVTWLNHLTLHGSGWAGWWGQLETEPTCQQLVQGANPSLLCSWGEGSEHNAQGSTGCSGCTRRPWTLNPCSLKWQGRNRWELLIRGPSASSVACFTGGWTGYYKSITSNHYQIKAFEGHKIKHGNVSFLPVSLVGVGKEPQASPHLGALKSSVPCVQLKSSYCISGQCTESEYTCGNLEGMLLLPPLLFLLILLILAIGISYTIWHCWYLKFTFHTPYEIVSQIVGKNSCPIISVNYVSKNIAKTIFWGKPYCISSLQIRAVKHIEVRFCTSSCSQEVTDLDHKPRLLVCDLFFFLLVCDLN